MEGVVGNDAGRHHSAMAEPLTKERLFGWHAALFPTGYGASRRITVGAWRKPEAGPMQVVSGYIGHEKVHFEAPRCRGALIWRWAVFWNGSILLMSLIRC